MYTPSAEPVGSEDPTCVESDSNSEDSEVVAFLDDRDEDDPEFEVESELSCVGMDFSQPDPAMDDAL